MTGEETDLESRGLVVGFEGQLGKCGRAPARQFTSLNESPVGRVSGYQPRQRRRMPPKLWRPSPPLGPVEGRQSNLVNSIIGLEHVGSTNSDLHTSSTALIDRVIRSPAGLCV